MWVVLAIASLWSKCIPLTGVVAMMHSDGSEDEEDFTSVFLDGVQRFPIIVDGYDEEELFGSSGDDVPAHGPVHAATICDHELTDMDDDEEQEDFISAFAGESPAPAAVAIDVAQIQTFYKPSLTDGPCRKPFFTKRQRLALESPGIPLEIPILAAHQIR